jgi:hypothetical protein
VRKIDSDAADGGVHLRAYCFRPTVDVLATGQRPYILGIVSGSIPIFDASLPSGGAYYRIGLGMVYSADTVREVLDSFPR